MRPHAHLLLAVFVLHARAATIPEHIQPEIEKEIIKDEIKTTIENISSEQELIDQVNTIKDVPNNLRNSVVEAIPVEIILEEVRPTLKTNINQETVNEVSDEEIQRPIVDLKNPGPPQRQEHETQNPDHYDDAERTVSSVKEEFKETQILFKQGFQGVTEGIQNWYMNHDNLKAIQTSIENMHENFASQIQKLNDTLHNVLHPDETNPNGQEALQIKENYAQIESRLKTLQNNFNNGVKTLSEGVNVVAMLRDVNEPASSAGQESSSSGSTTTTAPAFSGPMASLMEMMSNFQNSMSTGFANLTQSISNFVAPNQNWGIQNIFQGSSTTASPVNADASSTTAQPSNWQAFQSSVANLLNLNQGANNQGSQPAQPGPFGFFQNFPLVQNFTSLFQPNRPDTQTTQKPSETPGNEGQAGSSPAPAEEPAEKPAEKPEEKPADTKPEPEKKPEQTGPIRQLLQNNPIIKGINGAVQRIQGTMANPEKPRETEETDETKQKKGGGFYGPNRPGPSGDNNDSGSGLKADDVHETVLEDKVEEIKGTVTVPEKTE